MYFPLLKFFKYENFDALPQLGNNHNLDPKSIIIHLLKILAFFATITAKNNYHGTNQKRENRFLTNQKTAVIILAQ
jgi:hypothetical protein